MKSKRPILGWYLHVRLVGSCVVGKRKRGSDFRRENVLVEGRCRKTRCGLYCTIQGRFVDSAFHIVDIHSLLNSSFRGLEHRRPEELEGPSALGLLHIAIATLERCFRVPSLPHDWTTQLQSFAPLLIVAG